MTRQTGLWLLIILVLATLVRMVHLSTPIAGWHDWRQADTAAIARNFYESGHGPLYPQIDWRGNTAGYVESEFPFYTFMVSLVYRLTGVHDAVGRAISILFSLGGIVGIFILARRFWGERAGLYAAMVLAILPLNVIVSRAFMPESVMLAASIWGVLFFWRWCERDHWQDYFASAVCISLTILIKPPALYLGLPLLVILILTRGWRVLGSPWIWVWVLLILAPVAAWFYHAFRLWQETQLSFGIWAVGTDKWGNLDLLQTGEYYKRVFGSHLVYRNLLPIGVMLVLLGLVSPRDDHREWIVDAWLAAVLIYFLIVARGCYEHDYYQVPILAPAALLIARGLNHLETWIRSWGLRRSHTVVVVTIASTFCLLVGTTFPVTRDLFTRDFEDTDLLEMAETVRQHTEPDALVISLNQNNPLSLYHAHRKGWNLKTGHMDVRFFEKRRPLGAAYFFGEKRHLDSPELQELLREIADRYQVVVDEPGYFLWKLDPNPLWREVDYLDGWQQPEAWGRWGMATELRIRVPATTEPSKLVVTATTWPGAGEPPRVTVWHDSNEIGEFVVDGPPWRWRPYTLDLPAMGGSDTHELTLICDRLWPANRGDKPSRALPVIDIATVSCE